MMGWGAFLAAIAGPLVKRAAVALGLGVATFAGYSVLVAQLHTWMTQRLGSLMADVYAMFALIGFVDSLGIWLAAFSALAGLAAFGKIQRVTA